jgi:hypothetical protein
MSYSSTHPFVHPCLVLVVAFVFACVAAALLLHMTSSFCLGVSAENLLIIAHDFFVLSGRARRKSVCPRQLGPLDRAVYFRNRPLYWYYLLYYVKRNSCSFYVPTVCGYIPTVQLTMV